MQGFGGRGQWHPGMGYRPMCFDGVRGPAASRPMPGHGVPMPLDPLQQRGGQLMMDAFQPMPGPSMYNTFRMEYDEGFPHPSELGTGPPPLPLGSAGQIPPPPPPDETNHGTPCDPAIAPLPSIKVVKNDYNQHFVDTGERPQNFIRDHEPSVRFTEYPKLARLIRLKDELNKRRAHPPVHIKADLKTFDWSSLFDVILVDPPWREYSERAASLGAVVAEDLTPWTVDEMIQYLKVDKISEVPSFCFLWCGTSHLDEGRRLLQAWGFRRCEDICWCKMNAISSRRKVRRLEITDENGLFQRTTEHCLMGVKGLVKRSTDTHFIHSNIDTDVIVEEEPTDAQGKPSASTQKPVELHEMIERFCLGRKKLELFGLDRNIRPGWLTIGQEISVTNYDPERYLSWVADTSPTPMDSTSDVANFLKGSGSSTLPSETAEYCGGRYVGSTPEIDQLRPKSPPRSMSRSTPNNN